MERILGTLRDALTPATSTESSPPPPTPLVLPSAPTDAPLVMPTPPTKPPRPKSAATVVYFEAQTACNCAVHACNNLVQLALFLVIAMAVDPYRPVTVFAIGGTIVGYVKIAVSSAESLRRRATREIQTRYLELNKAKLKIPRLKKQTLSRLDMLIHSELDKVRRTPSCL